MLAHYKYLIIIPSAHLFTKKYHKVGNFLKKNLRKNEEIIIIWFTFVRFSAVRLTEVRHPHDAHKIARKEHLLQLSYFLSFSTPKNTM